MATSKLSSKQASEVTAAMLEARNTFHLDFALGNIQLQYDTNWEEITCVGYNPEMMRLEAVVNIKQPSGYNGNLCSLASHEFIRFYVDFKDGHGFRDMGLTSFKSADILNTAPLPKHPI